MEPPAKNTTLAPTKTAGATTSATRTKEFPSAPAEKTTSWKQMEPPAKKWTPACTVTEVAITSAGPKAEWPRANVIRNIL
ncbi:hypothetical protein AVEN_182373-1 [Araneus ventricosus]|uniref:Uncharacterized protein n=1 Tax=Araneus ventricosus TaxID=182803 RepID=A0A4Y2NML9_ARAVE|nr:hypothetical protein AVEN_182373-1 [Araneus ventricosus]